MDLINLPFPPGWQLAASALFAPLLVWAVLTAPWFRFDASEPTHVWYGTILGLIFLWSIKASIAPGFTVHLLGVSLFTLMAGPRFALIGTALVIVVVTALRDGWWANYALCALLLAVVPVVATMTILRVSERWLPPNLFVYLFLAAFFGAALAMSVAGLLACAAAVLGADQPGSVVFDQYLPYLIYLSFAEATITGMLTTLFVVYRPGWVATFDDARYLRRP